MTELLDAALAYARRGWPVFPLHGIVSGHCRCGRECSSPGKHPLVPHGVHDATTDARAIEEWWTRWPAANIGTATGKIVVIDIDLPSAFGSVDGLPELPRTLASLTGGGGVHLFYRSNRQLRNHASRLPGIEFDLPGVDLRGNGGYVVVPPSAHISGNRYEWLDESVEITQAPDWLQDRRRPHPVGAGAPVVPATESTAYGLAALRPEIDILLRTPVGRRNDQLNRSAFALGQLVASGDLAEAHARSALATAGDGMGLSAAEVGKTVESGLGAGQMYPRVARPSPAYPDPAPMPGES